MFGKEELKRFAPLALATGALSFAGGYLAAPQEKPKITADQAFLMQIDARSRTCAGIERQRGVELGEQCFGLLAVQTEIFHFRNRANACFANARKPDEQAFCGMLRIAHQVRIAQHEALVREFERELKADDKRRRDQKKEVPKLNGIAISPFLGKFL